MKLTKVQIHNYCSIKDSTPIYLEDNITVLAGKNESGKTAVLNALADFDVSRPIRPDARPLGNLKALPTIKVTFHLEKDDLRSLLEPLGIDAIPDGAFELEIIKTFPDKYSPGKSTLAWVEQLVAAHNGKLIEAAAQDAQSLAKLIRNATKAKTIIPAPLAAATHEASLEAIATFLKKATELLQAEPESMTDEIRAIIDSLTKLLTTIKKSGTSSNEFFEALKKLIPRFIYFDNFDNLLPYKLPLAEVGTNKAVNDFFQMASIDLRFLQSPENDTQARRSYLATKSTTITGNFLDYWNQDRVELITSLDGDNIILGFKEGDKSDEFKMEQRSKGFQWFLSFYVQLTLHQSAKQSYLLIDEPGLYLHAKAQMDVLKVLEDHSRQIPVIFSTHSPYLIEYDKLSRVRLVFKEKDRGTIVESKYHKVSDKETLRPILTAIGLEITSGITNPDKLNNVIVEGACDWYYLTAFKSVLDISDLNFIYGGGSGNMPQVGTILQGWGCKVLYLYDNDQGKKDGERHLRDHWLVETEQVKGISKEKAISAIEDLFTTDDFKQCVMNDPKLNYQSKNSEYVKDQDKALKAKTFLSEINSKSGSLSGTTKNEFKRLMDELREEFK
jgi:predicted ATP-dependent endonuclease of OLD family